MGDIAVHEFISLDGVIEDPRWTMDYPFDPRMGQAIAGIMGAKATSTLIPLCHPLPITKVEIEIDPEHALPGFLVEATVKVTGQTGVEMEALTAVSVACLTIYDMVKAIEKGMRIEGIRLLEKQGGKSGTWRAEDQR